MSIPSAHHSVASHPFERNRVKLAAAYQSLGILGMDDMIATHHSVRSEDGLGFWLPPFGYLYEEMAASRIMQVFFTDLSDPRINPTAAVFHNAVYQARPDVNAVFHLHTEAMIAVASSKNGFKSLSQWALFFHNKVGSYEYDGLALDHGAQARRIAKALENNKILLLQNHGALICGESIEEAFFNAYYLERACKAQCAMASFGEENIIHIPEEMCAQTHAQLMMCEGPVGHKLFEAMLRKLDRLEIHYAD